MNPHLLINSRMMKRFLLHIPTTLLAVLNHSQVKVTVRNGSEEEGGPAVGPPAVENTTPTRLTASPTETKATTTAVASLLSL